MWTCRTATKYWWSSLFKDFLSEWICSSFSCMLSGEFDQMLPISNTKTHLLYNPATKHTQAPSYRKSPFYWDKKRDNALKPRLSWSLTQLYTINHFESLCDLMLESSNSWPDLSLSLRPRGWMFIAMVWSDTRLVGPGAKQLKGDKDEENGVKKEGGITGSVVQGCLIRGQ